MIQVSNLSMTFGGQKLFSGADIKFLPGNCYGVIGANGAGKSTFLRVLSGELEPTTGYVSYPPTERLSTLKQNQFAYDEYMVLDTVIMGNQRLYDIRQEKEELYAKPDFTDADGERAAELEGEFAEMDGWNAESDAATLLTGLGIPMEMHELRMSELTGGDKFKVLLAQALFGNPDILLLDEHTAALDPLTAEKVLNITKEVVAERNITTLMITHNIASALELGNRTLMMDDGQIVLDLQNEDREALDVPGLLQKYREVKGKLLDNDRILLSQ